MDSAILAVAFLVIAAAYGAAAFHYGAWCQRRFHETEPVIRRRAEVAQQWEAKVEEALRAGAAGRQRTGSEHPAGPPPPMPNREPSKWTTPSIS